MRGISPLSGSSRVSLSLINIGLAEKETEIGPDNQVWIWYVIKEEMRHFVTTRQRHLIDPEHSASAQANTILITGVPTRYLSEKALTKLFSHLPGGVRKVWLNRFVLSVHSVFAFEIAEKRELTRILHYL